MTQPTSLARLEHDALSDSFRRLSVGNHRSAQPTVTPPIAIPQKNPSRRSFELIKVPPRRRSSTSYSSSPELPVDAISKDAFLQLFTQYCEGKKTVEYTINVLQKNSSHIADLMKDDGQEVMKRLGNKKIECLSRLFAVDASNFPKNVPLRENTLCTSFYREFCKFHFESALQKCASKPKKELVSTVKYIKKKLEDQDLTDIRTVHTVMSKYIPTSEIGNFSGLVIVTFINRVVAPLFMSAGFQDRRQKEMGISLQKGAASYMHKRDLSDEEKRAFDSLAALLYTGKV